jgi:uncharacterized protein YraI
MHFESAGAAGPGGAGAFGPLVPSHIPVSSVTLEGSGRREDVIVRRTMVFLLICGLVAGCDSGGDAPTTTAGTSAPTTTLASTTTTTVPATTTTAAATSTTAVADGWRVIDVASDDVLNVREGPGTWFPVVHTFAYDETGIRLTGNVAKVGLLMWAEAEIPDGTGWSAARFLAPDDPADLQALEIELALGQAFDEPGAFAVVDVASDDVLNVRAGPGTGYDVEGTLLPDGTGIWSTGNYARVTGTTWVELETPEAGWAHAGFMDPAAGLTAQDPCDAGAAASTFPASTTGSGSAGRVVGLDWAAHGSGGDYCERFILDLGNGALGDVTVEREIDYFHIVLPGVTTVDSDATELVPGSTLLHSVYTVRSDTSNRQLYVNVHINADVQATVRWNTAPPQVIIDLVPGAAPPGSIRRPVADKALVLSRQLAPPVTARDYPIEVLGYGRPFESYVDVSVTAPSGDPVTIRWRDGTETQNGGQTQTTDWTDTWGEFRFTIVSGPSGEVLTLQIEDAMTESLVVDQFPVN